jgi:hypothetical protein
MTTLSQKKVDALAIAIASAALASIIGEGIHTSLRKYVDSPQSSRAWQAIHDLPDGEWSVVCQVVAEHLIASKWIR